MKLGVGNEQEKIMRKLMFDHLVANDFQFQTTY